MRGVASESSLTRDMNAKTVSVILAVAGLGLGIGWYQTSRLASEDRARSTSHLLTLSNELVATTSRLTEQQKVNASLESNLAHRIEEVGLISNRWTYVAAELTRTEAEAKAAAEAARIEIEKKDKQISQLEGEREDLTKKMDGLTEEITGLNGKIADTEKKLATSEGNREQLQRELKRLLSEKAELERKFNDLAMLRDQVRKLREELSVARRIDMIRRGLYGSDKKGAEVLNQGFRRPAPASTNPPAPLEAELGSDGSSKVKTPAPK